MFIYGWVQRSQGPETYSRSPNHFRRLPTRSAQQGAYTAATVQTLAFRAATGKAFTIFFAGLAFTMTTLPKTSLLPAFCKQDNDGSGYGDK